MLAYEKVGALALASTAPVDGSITTMAPTRPDSACSAAAWIFELMVRTTELPGVSMPASELRALSQLE